MLTCNRYIFSSQQRRREKTISHIGNLHFDNTNNNTDDDKQLMAGSNNKLGNITSKAPHVADTLITKMNEAVVWEAERQTKTNSIKMGAICY